MKGDHAVLAAAAAVGHLLKLDADRMLHAFGSAGTQAAGLWEFLRDAADSKQLHTAHAASAGLMAAQLAGQGFRTIDLVAVNLYPFEETIAKPNVTYADAIENIDIGGVTLIRAAAKNHERTALICDPADYNSVLQELQKGGISEGTRRKLAVKGFASTAHYDTAIHAYLKEKAE